MSQPPFRLLIVDFDPDALIALEHVLENAGFSTNTTWCKLEAVRLASSRHFDFFIVGDHPPELDAEQVLGDLQVGGLLRPCLVLGGASHGSDDERLRTATAVVPRGDHVQLLEQLRRYSRPRAVGAVPLVQALAS